MSVQLKRVFLKPGREKSLLRRHPWVFSGAIERVEGSPAVGETVDVVASTGEFLARGAYSPASQIRLRVWTFDEEESVDEAFIARRLARAVESRERLGLVDPEGACRLVFAESDGLPGLIVDRYADFVVCQLLSAGADSLRATIAELLEELCGARGVYERSEASARKKEGLKSQRGLLRGAEPPAELEVDVGGARWLVDVANGQKTGAYLDQQRNRLRVADFAAGGEVLDAFSYTGGFAIAALFQKIVAGAALDARRDAQIIERLSQPADHPVAIEFPEAEYLKGLILRVH